MDKKDTIEKRIDKLNKEFGELLDGIPEGQKQPKTLPQNLSAFGLTLDEAQAWLEQEPNFLSDVSYHEPQNRRKVTRTETSAGKEIKYLFCDDVIL
jgi:hypothetical protein